MKTFTRAELAGEFTCNFDMKTEFLLKSEVDKWKESEQKRVNENNALLLELGRKELQKYKSEVLKIIDENILACENNLRPYRDKEIFKELKSKLSSEPEKDVQNKCSRSKAVLSSESSPNSKKRS